MTHEPPPAHEPLSPADRSDARAELASYLRATPRKTLLTLVLAPVLMTLSMRVATVQTGRALLGERRDPLYAWYYVFALQFALMYAIPAACIKLGFREPLRDYGHRGRPALKLWPLAIFFVTVMLPLVYLASLQPSFQRFYPMYPGSYRGWGPFLAFEAGLFVLFFTQEFFFRGFMIEALAPQFGLTAVLISTSLYAVGHYTKPLPEQLGAFVVGNLLGYLGLRYRTFYFGVLVHYGVALAMDASLVVPALLGRR